MELFKFPLLDVLCHVCSIYLFQPLFHIINHLGIIVAKILAIVLLFFGNTSTYMVWLGFLVYTMPNGVLPVNGFMELYEISLELLLYLMASIAR